MKSSAPPEAKTSRSEIVETACDECIQSIQYIYGTALNDIDAL